MATVPSSAAACGFGFEPVPPDLLRLCRALEPPPCTSLENGLDVAPELGVVSHELLLAAALGRRADCIYAFCRLNAEAVRSLVLAEIRSQAVPVSVDGAAAEVLAEIADAARFVAPSRVAELYASIPQLAASVVTNVVDETLGFVPTCEEGAPRSTIAATLADRLEIPVELLGLVAALVDEPTQKIVAAQALLQLSQHDRSLLLALPARVPRGRAATRTVASLLSEDAARRRLVDEYDRIARWLRHALEQDADTARPGEETA